MTYGLRSLTSRACVYAGCVYLCIHVHKYDCDRSQIQRHTINMVLLNAGRVSVHHACLHVEWCDHTEQPRTEMKGEEEGRLPDMLLSQEETVWSTKHGFLKIYSFVPLNFFSNRILYQTVMETLKNNFLQKILDVIGTSPHTHTLTHMHTDTQTPHPF